MHPTPRQILETLLPYLKTAGAYAQEIQARIAIQPDKNFDPDNFFATALSDADLSVQTFVEVALLAHFPHIRFFGEEHEQTYNTKYFRALDLGPAGDYLLTLDPIDGTRFYLDGHNNYQIILTVLNHDEFEAVLAITPGQNRYYYTLRGQGTFSGTLDTPMDQCEAINIRNPKPSICLGWKLGHLIEPLQDRYQVVHTKTHYSRTRRIPNFNGLLNGELTGAVMAVGKWIDGGALAFMAQEAGYIVTTFEGTPPPPLHTCQNYERPGLVIASSPEVHDDLMEALQQQLAGG